MFGNVFIDNNDINEYWTVEKICNINTSKCTPTIFEILQTHMQKLVLELKHLEFSIDFLIEDIKNIKIGTYFIIEKYFLDLLNHVKEVSTSSIMATIKEDMIMFK